MIVKLGLFEDFLQQNQGMNLLVHQGEHGHHHQRFDDDRLIAGYLIQLVQALEFFKDHFNAPARPVEQRHVFRDELFRHDVGNKEVIFPGLLIEHANQAECLFDLGCGALGAIDLEIVSI